MGLQQKLETKMALTPQLKQSLEILQYSLQELETYIREQADSNPLIELKEPSTIQMARLPEGDYSRNISNENDYDPFSQIASGENSLELYLLEQLAMQKGLSRIEKKVIVYFIQSLNDVGYLDCDLEEVAEQFDLSVQQCETILQILQSFDPIGIGARNLIECLSLQLRIKADAPSLTLLFVQNHLEQLADRKFQQLADQYEIEVKDVEQIFTYIKQLNPHPIIEANVQKTEYIIPDIIVEKFNGEYIIRVNDISLPQISINSYYEELLRANADDETNQYLKTKLSDAVLLIKGIKQRHETLYKVINIILKKQNTFLDLGNKGLKPLRLKDVASVAELHESTISRTIHKKYIQTPKGIFPIKALFVRGVTTESGETESTIVVKEKIKLIIEKEDTAKPLSDQKITKILLDEGIQIARRTVAKYREELGILQSTKRKKAKT